MLPLQLWQCLPLSAFVFPQLLIAAVVWSMGDQSLNQGRKSFNSCDLFHFGYSCLFGSFFPPGTEHWDFPSHTILWALVSSKQHYLLPASFPIPINRSWALLVLLNSMVNHKICHMPSLLKGHTRWMITMSVISLSNLCWSFRPSQICFWVRHNVSVW